METKERARQHFEKLIAKGSEKLQDRFLTLLRLLEGFSPANLQIVYNSFIETAKVLSVRQNRLNKAQLKPKEVRSALQLVAFHYDNTKEVDATLHELNAFLGKEPSEDDAFTYFEKTVMGRVNDVYGREIVISEDGLKHLYKEDVSGKHVIATDNFMPMRAKRLPWIRWTIQNTREIYKKRDNNWIVYGYVQTFRVPLKPSSVANYFLVIIRKKDRQAPLELVTSYHMEDHEDFLKRIEDFQPFVFSEPQSEMFTDAS